MSDGRAANAAITEKIYYDDDIVKKFIYATIFWGARGGPRKSDRVLSYEI